MSRFFAKHGYPVKPTRTAPRSGRPFGDGLEPEPVTIVEDPAWYLAPNPAAVCRYNVTVRRAGRVPDVVSTDSLATTRWLAREMAPGAAVTERLEPMPAPIRGGAPEPDWDALADEAEAADRFERGVCPYMIPLSVAERIAATRSGHLG